MARTTPPPTATSDPTLTDRVSLHPFGASNVTSQLTVFKGLMAGDERGHALTGAKAAKYKTYGAAEQVDAVALDDFFARQRLRSIYHVAIDTEGWDALVIEGMRTALMEKVREGHGSNKDDDVQGATRRRTSGCPSLPLE